MEIVLTGKPITAQRAYEIGLVNRIAEPADLMDAALELAREVIEGAPLSVAAARETVMLATEMGRSAALQAARAAHEYTYNSEDSQEGPRALLSPHTSPLPLRFGRARTPRTRLSSMRGHSDIRSRLGHEPAPLCRHLIG